MSQNEVTLRDLLREMLSKFENDESPKMTSNNDFNPSYPEVLLIVFKWFMNIEEIAQQLIDQYTAVVSVQNEGGKVLACQSRKKAVARAFKFWQTEFSEDFQKSKKEMNRKLIILQRLMENSGDTALLEYMQIDTLPDDQWGRSSSFKMGSRIRRRASFGFDQMEAEDLAQILTSIDYKLFRRVPFREFCVYAQAAKLKDDETSRIEECIHLFNGITIWVVCNILREYTMLKRADIIEKFIDTARHLSEMGSYNTMLAVVGGLNHFSIKRLQQTWSKVDSKKKDELERYVGFFSMENNYSAYRQRVVHCAPGVFQMPVLGIVLKDLIAVDGQSKDYLDREHTLVNLSKYQKLCAHLTRIRQYQVTSPAFPPDTECMTILRAAVTQNQMSDDALDELSQTREPPVHNPSSPTRRENRLPKFSAWVSGSMPQLDASTLKKHVAKMVDSVFKAYDTDQSGYISIDEFQSISSNFPFIESFSVLDRDKDGVISREEMLEYFLCANTSLRESFKHNFAETTFIASVYCEHCRGVLKGIVKQGVRCKDCGITCHKYCKDYVVADCSKRGKSKPKRKVTVSSANGEFEGEGEVSLKERLQRAEAARDALSAENTDLHAQLADANAKIQQLNGYIAMIRQHTIGFILEQMNTLTPQSDTAV